MELLSLKYSEIDNLVSFEDFDEDDSDIWLKPHGILDVYDHCLTEEEVDKTSLGGKNPLIEHNLKHEGKFIDFLHRAIAFNENRAVIIEIPLEGFTNRKVLELFAILDYEDKLKLLEFIRNMHSLSSDFLEIKDVGTIQLFLKLATRELSDTIFHFQKYKMSLRGNFDLSFPIFFENAEIKNQYSKIAKEAGLYIR